MHAVSAGAVAGVAELPFAEVIPWPHAGPAERMRRQRRAALVAGTLAWFVLVVGVFVGSHPFAGSGAADGSHSQVAATVAEPAATSAETYTVKAGDSLWSIGERLAPAGVEVEEAMQTLVTANPELADDGLHPGDRLSLPRSFR